MSEKNRIFGLNLKYYLWQNQMADSVFANIVGYSVADIWRIEDGRVNLARNEKEEIANALQVSVDDMYVKKTDLDYQQAECFECRGNFGEEKNRKLILDLFDSYCDVQEMLADQNV